ncbi:MAG: methyltransferase [Deltaproteobacteria bacterium]|nr:methyltransferase [Deltaproteobacteria bacterium]
MGNPERQKAKGPKPGTCAVECSTIEEHTVLHRPFACPELLLRLVTPECVLWSATELDLKRLGLEDPFWGFAWGGGQALARFLLDHPEVVRGARVLDFGAGSGLCAIAAVKAGAARVTASEIDEVATTAMALNAALNGVEFDVCLDDMIGVLGPWDVVLAGDVCYDRQLTERLTSWFQALLVAGTRVLVGDPGRGFLPELGRETLACVEVPADVDVGGTHLRTASVLELVASTPRH